MKGEWREEEKLAAIFMRATGGAYGNWVAKLEEGGGGRGVKSLPLSDSCLQSYIRPHTQQQF